MVTRVSDANQRLLRRYLSRYNNLKKVKKRLEERQHEIEMDFRISPFTAIRQSEGGGFPGESKVPPYVLALDDILTELTKVKNEATYVLADILSILDLLDHDGLKYLALTLRYIDGWSEEQICEYIPCASRTYYRLIDDGIDELLNIPAVRSRMNLYAIEVTKIPKIFKVDS